jgi:hypothetical protein
MMANQLNQREQRAMENDRQYRNNLLAQRDREWTTPNATSAAGYDAQRGIAELPWTKGMTPAEQERINLERERIKAIQGNPLLGGGGGSGFLASAARHAESETKRKQDAEGAASILNAMTEAALGEVAMPTLKERLDAGSDNSNWFGGLTSGNAEKAASAMAGLGPQPAWYGSDRAVQGTQQWFNTNRNQFLKAAAQRALLNKPELSAFATWDEQQGRWVPNYKPTPFLGGAWMQPSTQVQQPTVAPTVQTNVPTIQTNTPVVSPFNVGGYSFTPIQ